MPPVAVPTVSPRVRGARRIAAALAAAGLAFALAACAPDPVSQQYLEGGNQGYISGEFAVTEIGEADRGEPVEWAGVTETGEALSSEDVAGEVVVVNFWYAQCDPCRAEAADLESVWQEYQADGVRFVGINTRDQADQAISFAEKHGVTYPSIIDVHDGAVKLAFVAATPVNATPVTLVLDREGRVAARIIGQLESASILSTLVGETLEEGA
ncbi:TlpA disulfide reductase family protein [Microbacterium sp. MEC084]|uniref:TlpA family protein disulfide reductase n=1 Tax=Microbacterium sp. MEC084 TaxID=1963027 RepID=UPI001E5A81F4|nr:TlpA disulfide reductase family protein [Microbacterium sp. MEC084]